ncbi:hypothetical protein LOTGIDRAFT_170350 [Lottia gigantea]|uniref:Uncharacterized protein n=1 Tax=Lottia gigantea TaxID=225164 RepID=V3ZML3_LOTGI|nr:hypothetical protein LOTGIDRAFT_170350 [Lottia gigantea]ESO82076.1 hypothetical protein LOTGIDRAFT_170350 [Lottia gigantea]
MGVIAIIAVVLAGVGLGLHTMGMSVVYWIVADPFISGYGVGLWQTCSIVGCHRHPPVPEYWKATQAFVVIGFIVGVVAVIFSIILICKQNKVFSVLAGLACFLAAGCILTAIIIFGTETRLQRRTQWGWGFIMCIVSTFFFVAAGILNCTGLKKST